MLEGCDVTVAGAAALYGILALMICVMVACLYFTAICIRTSQRIRRRPEPLPSQPVAVDTASE